jgi:hypothetical protein
VLRKDRRKERSGMGHDVPLKDFMLVRGVAFAVIK